MKKKHEIVLVLVLMAFLGTSYWWLMRETLPVLNKEEHIALYESEDNGYLKFMQAADLHSENYMGKASQAIIKEMTYLDRADSVSKELREWIVETQPVIDSIREGFDRPYSISPYMDVNTVGNELPKLAKLRSIARLLNYWGALHHIDGELDAAIECYLDEIRLSKASAQEGTMMVLLVSYAVQRYGTDPLYQLIPELDEKQLRYLILVLEEEMEKSISFDKVVAIEKERNKISFNQHVSSIRALGVMEWWDSLISIRKWNHIRELREADIPELILKAKVRLYSLENGEAPASMDEVMEGLPIPIDPTTSKPFLFRDGDVYSKALEEQRRKNEEQIKRNISMQQKQSANVN